jgi:hypothetical protein
MGLKISLLLDSGGKYRTPHIRVKPQYASGIKRAATKGP